MKKLIFLLLLLLPSLALAEFRTCPTNPTKNALNVTASGDNAIIASDPVMKIYVWQWFFVNSHATQDENITLKEGSTSVSGVYLVKAAGGSHTAPCTGMPWAVVPAGSAFQMNLSANGSIQGTIYFTRELQ